MKSYVFAILAGASCLPATYNLSREGSIPLALIVVAIIGGSCGFIVWLLNKDKNNQHTGLLILLFAFGALISEVIVFTRYYFGYGYQDPKLSVGIALSLLEFGVITVVGCLAIFSATFVAKRRITHHSSGTPNGAP